MMNFKVAFGNVVDYIKGDSLMDVKKNFTRKLINEGKTETKNFIIVMNKVKIEEANNMDMDMDMDMNVSSIVSDVSYVENKKVGRPVNPNSARQIKLKERQKLLEAGVVFKRGRKADPNSANQIRLQKKAEMEAQGIIPTRGRPINPKSVRQQKLQAKTVTMA